jgi:hypothetical protein
LCRGQGGGHLARRQDTLYLEAVKARELLEQGHVDPIERSRLAAVIEVVHLDIAVTMLFMVMILMVMVMVMVMVMFVMMLVLMIIMMVVVVVVVVL